ncbi:carbohydrate kinase [Paramesorhizobium deserti]|uniref:Carbohydrate kinase n=1 Tax=Paramesorhizobium deserti TaxID=1494590 RepID=A0A135HS06_9HYPH|nr:carbohydrate kinase [Paramesorhizobium deserti]
MLAVFDLGKTNSKLFVFSADGALLDERRTKPVWRGDGDIRVLDDDALFAWMRGALATAVADHGVNRVMFSGHGCTFALTEGDRLAHPVLDYEQEPPADTAVRIERRIPDFQETFSPRLPLGFNFGRHMLWLQERAPDIFENADAILGYPQFWTWKFSGAKLSEVSYLGCHSHLWAPLCHDFSSLVDTQGWREKMPGFARAGAVVGEYKVALADGTSVPVKVHNGVHDSNAALYFYRSAGFTDFTLVSTGTWVIIFNTACPLDALDRERDMLANVTVDGEPAATIRFMGGREYDVASGGWDRPISLRAIKSIIEKNVFALPSFAPGGPLPGLQGQFIGPEPDGEERAAAALLYVVLMTDLSLDLIRSRNTIIIDGGLVKTGLYTGLLAQLRLSQTFMTNANAEGSAFGAAALAFEAAGITPFANSCEKVRPTQIADLESYRARWRDLVDQRRHKAWAGMHIREAQS